MLIACVILSILSCICTSASMDEGMAVYRRAPLVLPAPKGERPALRKIATPAVRTLLGYTRRILHLPDGHSLAAFSFGSAPTANQMYLVDSRDLSVKRFAIPNNDFASHGAALGKDGKIYIFPYGASRAYVFVPGEERFQALQVPLPAGEYTWEALGASNGKLYFGTYPNAIFGEYDPITGKTALYPQSATGAKYVTDLREETDGTIRFRAWGSSEFWLRFDPVTGRLTPAPGPASVSASAPLPVAPPRDLSFSGAVSVAGHQFALSFPSGRLWEMLPNRKPKLIGDSGGPGEPWYLETVTDAVVGISHFGAIFRYDLKTGALKRAQMPNLTPGGNAIMFLEAISPRGLLGANYSQQNLFQVDSRTGKVKSSEQMVSRFTGEVMCAVGLKGKAYLGIYINAVLAEYDPAKPFRFGVNPRERIALNPEYAQTRPEAAVTDGERVYIASSSAYGKLGGALSVITPGTSQVEVYPQLLRDLDLNSLAWDRKTGLLWGGTNRWGQMRAHPPTQPDSLLYAFDPGRRQVTRRLVLWPGTDVTTVLGVSGDGLLIAASGREVAFVDTVRGEILYRGAFPVGIPNRIRLGADGYGYLLADGVLYRWDFPANTLTPATDAPGCVHLTEFSPGEWALADTASVYRLRLPRVSRSRQ